MTRFKIIINCGPCEEFVAQCVESVRAQSHAAWEAYLTADPCGDNTYGRALRAAADDPRVHVHLNETRRYSMWNLVSAIQRSNAEPEDVIAMLDGDDWFSTPDALRIIANAYEERGCWMSYGSWLSNVPRAGGGRDGAWPAYPEGTTDFRRTRWLGTAVRTWKRWLWDHLNDTDLRNDEGRYFRVSEDQAIMLPLLEMCGTDRARHIATPIMVYNKKAKYSISPAITEEIERNALLLDRRPTYRRLEAKVYRGIGVAQV